MHTCKPPSAAIGKWLTSNGNIDNNYGHLLLEQCSVPDAEIVASVRAYFESAHLDAREHFHDQIALSLHPDADAPGVHACYPNCLPSTAKRGLFGEVMAGMVTEAFQHEFVGGHKWSVPIFLFRFHADVESYLWSLARDPARRRQIFGRFGSDFIGVCLDDTGSVARVIAGEAKWRGNLTPSAVQELLLGPKIKDSATDTMVHSNRGIWFEINRDTPVPHGLRQLQRLLEQRDPAGHAAAILSIDRAVALDGPPLARTNLVLLSGNGAKTRKPLDVLIPWEAPPGEYGGKHDLQVVELILENGEHLIDLLYGSLWRDAA